jgi:hypothetical protein
MYKISTVILALLTGGVMAHAQSVGEDAKSISHLLHGMFDKPSETLSVEPVMVSGDHAIADWTQGEMGGRALLRRQYQEWTIVLCAGDGIKSAEALVKVGVPAADAKKLESEMATAEAALAPQRVAMFSRFEGLMMMDSNGSAAQHPHH